MGSQKTEEECKKVMLGKKVDNIKSTMKNYFVKAGDVINKQSGAKQLVIGGVSGWFTGFMSTRVGKTVALSVGGSVILIAAANQAGVLNINWDKFGKTIEESKTKLEGSLAKGAPSMKTNISTYAKTNRMFAAGFVGGFLLGLCS